MATIKAYSDLEQSRKLAEILPLESADMYYHYNEYEERYYPKMFLNYETADIRQEVLELKRNDPCWSLAALLSVLPTLDNKHAVFGTSIKGSKWHVIYHNINTLFLEDSGLYDNLVDACVAMIEKLHELNLL